MVIVEDDEKWKVTNEIIVACIYIYNNIYIYIIGQYILYIYDIYIYIYVCENNIWGYMIYIYIWLIYICEKYIYIYIFVCMYIWYI